MDEVLVSVIVPCYNVQTRGADVGICVQSAISQNVRPMEILLIDDGSTDETGEALEGIARKNVAQDVEIRVIHQANKGVSGARNAGIEAAKGEWIFFLDADDWIEPEGIGTLLDAAKAQDDIVCGAYTVSYADEGGRTRLFSPPHGDQQTVLESLIRTESALNSMCARLYRRDFLMQNDLRAPLGVKVGEDVLFNLRAFYAAGSYTLLDTSVYRYELGGASAMGGAKRDFYAAQRPMLEGIDAFLREKGLKDACFRAQADSVLRQLRRGKGRIGAAMRYAREMRPYLKDVRFGVLGSKEKIVYLIARFAGVLSVVLP